MSVDTFDDLIGQMRVEGSWYAHLRAGAPWGVDFERAPVARLVVLTAGVCLLTAEQLDVPIELSAGDCLFVQAGVGFTMQDAPGRLTVACEPLYAGHDGHHAVTGGDGPVTTIQSGRFTFDQTAAEPLMRLLPPIMRIQLDEPDAHALRATLDLIDSEIATAGMGVDSIVDRLADVLFVQALRAWCNSEQGTGIGWVAALKVRPLAAAMGAMHSDLAHPWTVAELARVAAMSRSAFAALFKAVTGDSPLTYLTCWRVYRAKTLLRDTDLPLTEIAVRVGYDSDTALSRGFRRFEPLPPGAWRRTHRSGP